MASMHFSMSLHVPSSDPRSFETHPWRCGDVDPCSATFCARFAVISHALVLKLTVFPKATACAIIFEVFSQESAPPTVLTLAGPTHSAMRSRVLVHTSMGRSCSLFFQMSQ